jgi:thiol-disulfide isomerase/thioredoxin
MKSRLLVVLLAAATLVVAGCSGKHAVDQTAGGQFRFVHTTNQGKLYPVPKRKKAENFTGNLLDGGTLKLSQEAGKVVLVNFWATWCPPCVAETPKLERIYRAYQDKGVSFIGVDVKDSPASKAKSFVKDNHVTYPIIYDEPAKTAVQLGNLPVTGMPFTVLIDKHRRVAAVYEGALKPPSRLTSALRKLLAEPGPKPGQGG